jgi:cupin fold WbuC family metalloprotein
MREAEGALFNTEPVLAVDGEMMEMLKERARRSPTLRYRLCLHHSTDDPVQQMIVVHCRGNDSRPHAHPTASMSYTMIEGEMTVVLFDGEGNESDRIELAAPGQGKHVCLRLVPGVIYMPVCRTETAVFHETLSSPNPDGSATVYGPNIQYSTRNSQCPGGRGSANA